MSTGKYITRPAYISSKTTRMPCSFICGAAYSESGLLIPASQRQFKDNDLYLNDPPVVPLVHRFKVFNFSDSILYLGNHFSHYGHFIMETLPMLSYLLDNKRKCFFNHLPFGKMTYVVFDGAFSCQIILSLKYFAKILEIDISSVFVNHENRISKDHNDQRMQSIFLGHDFLEILKYYLDQP